MSVKAPGNGAPPGTVTFLDGATTLGTGTLAGGTVTLTTSSLAVGTHSLSAVYACDGNFNGSTSATVTQVVNLIPTTTALTSSVNPSLGGQSVTFTATVTTSGMGTPTGTVQFKDGGSNIGSAVTLDASGVATFATSSFSSTRVRRPFSAIVSPPTITRRMAPGCIA